DHPNLPRIGDRLGRAGPGPDQPGPDQLAGSILLLPRLRRGDLIRGDLARGVTWRLDQGQLRDYLVFHQAALLQRDRQPQQPRVPRTHRPHRPVGNAPPRPGEAPPRIRDRLLGLDQPGVDELVQPGHELIDDSPVDTGETRDNARDGGDTRGDTRDAGVTG